MITLYAVRRSITVLLTLATLLGASLAPANAAPETISAHINSCRLSVSSYSVQLQSGNQAAPRSAFPASVTLTFADGSTASATSMLGPSFGTIYYRLDDTSGVYREKDLISGTTVFDTAQYPNYRFTVVAYPCDPTPDPVTYNVSGVITQHGNGKAVAGMQVCLVELDVCTLSDANGAFVFAGVPDGTYTLTSDGPVYKPLSTTVTVAGGDVYLDLVQYRGGGQG